MNTLRGTCVWACILSGVIASAQDAWRSVPTVPRGPRDPDEVGAIVDAVAIRGGKETKARVAVYGARESGILNIAIWIQGLDGLGDAELEPYMVMNLGREARNTRMMEFMLASPTGQVRFNSRMVVIPDGNFPRGVDDDGYDVLAADSKNNAQFMAFVHKMLDGFDQGESGGIRGNPGHP